MLRIRIGKYPFGPLDADLLVLIQGDPVYGLFCRFSVPGVWWIALVTHLIIYATVGTLVDYFHQGEIYLPISHPAELTNGISVWAVFVPMVWMYYRWFPLSFLRVARQLEERKVIRVGDNFQLFSAQLRDALFSKWIHTLAILATLISFTILWTVAVPIQNISLGKLDFWYYTPGARVTFSSLYLISNYILFALAFRAIAMVYVIGNFFSQKEVIHLLYPLHPDGCGGLGGIGKISSRIALIAVMIASWATVFALYPTIANGRPQWSTIVIVYVVYILVMPVILFLPLWKPHIAMMQYKHELLELLSKELLTVEQKCMKNTLSGIQKELDDDITRIKNIKEIYNALDSQLPVWPISFSVLRNFGTIASSPLLLGLLTFVIELVVNNNIPSKP